MTFHHLCIGPRTVVDAAGKRFVDWPTLLRKAGLNSTPTYLKMEVEGFELGVLRSMVTAGDQRLLPHCRSRSRSSMLHYQTQFRSLPFYGRFLTAGEIGLFMDFLWREAGYALIARHHNGDCRHSARLRLSCGSAAPRLGARRLRGGRFKRISLCHPGGITWTVKEKTLTRLHYLSKELRSHAEGFTF